MSEPGLDQHEWRSRWASIEEDESLDPPAALSAYAEIVESMLIARGYDLTDPVDRSGDEPEVVLTYLSAREVAERAALGESSRDEVRTAIEDLRAVFDDVADEPPSSRPRLPRARLGPSYAASAAVRRPSSPAIGCIAATTFAMCSSSSSPRSSAPA